MLDRLVTRGFAAVVAVALLALPALAGTKITVGKNGVNTIQQAVDQAVDGDTIIVPKGTYDEGVVIEDKTGIKIIGKGAVIRPPFEAVGFDILDSSNITIQGFDIDATGERGGILIDITTGVVISKCDIDGGASPGIDVLEGDGTVITKCDITNVQSHGILVRDSADVSITKTIVEGCTGSGIDASTGGGSLPANTNLVIQKCRIFNVGGDGIELSGPDPDCSKNTIKGGQRGISDDDSDAVTGGKIEKNKVDGNSQPSLDHRGSQTNVSKNKFAGPTATCTQVVLGGGTNVFEKNKVAGGTCNGVTDLGNGNQYSRNSIAADGTDATISLWGTGTSMNGDKVSNTMGSGIRLAGGGGHMLIKVTVKGVAGQGIQVESNGNVLDGVKVLKALLDGIWFQSSTNGNTVGRSKFLKNNTSGNENTFDVHDDAVDGQNSIDDTNKYGTRSEPIVI